MKSYEVRSWGIARTESGVCINGLCVETSDLWHSSEIVERISSNSLMTSSGNEYKLVGPMSYSSCSEKYFSTSFLKKFEDGFPENWKDLLMRCSKINKKTRKRSHEKYVKDMTNKKIKLDAEYPPCFLTSSPMPLQSPPPFRPVDKSKINKVYKSQLFPTNSDRINSTQKESHRHNSADLDDQMSSEEMNSQNSNPPPENIFQDVSVDILATSFGDCEIDEGNASREELMNDGSIFGEPVSKTIHKISTTSRSKRNRKNHTKIKFQEDDDDGGGSDDDSSTILSKRRRTDILDDDSQSDDDDVCAVEPSFISLSGSLPPSPPSDELEIIKSSRPRKNSKNNQKLSMKKKTKVILQKPCIVVPKKKMTLTKTGKVKKKGDNTSKKPVKNESKGTTSSQNKNETKQSKKTTEKLPNETSKTNKQQKAKPVAATTKAGKGKENLLEGHELLGGRPTLKKSRLLKKMMTEHLKSDENGKDFLANMTQENVQDEDAIKVMAMFDGDTLDTLGQQSDLTSSLFNKSMSNKSTMSSAALSRLNETTAMMLTRSPQNARDTELEIFRLNKIMKKRNTKPADDSQQSIKKKPLMSKYLTELPDEVFIMDEGGDGEDSERDNYFSESEMS